MESTNETLQRNKDIVLRFNRDVIERGDEQAFHEIVAPDFVNRTAPPWLPSGPDGVWHMFERVLRPAFPDLRVQIHDQMAEADKVITRKTITGTHLGECMGITPTNERVAIEIIDIVRLEGGRYVEHWGSNNLPSVLAFLRER